MSVVVSVEQTGPCRKQLKIEVPAPAVDAEFRRVVDEYAKKARIPGFRRGKVPADMVRRRFQPEIDREVVERLVPRYWRQAQAESRIEPLLPPQVGDVEFQPGSPLTFVATVETSPEVELRNTRDFELPEMATAPTDEEVDKALEDLRVELADWRPVERAAGRGDRVVGRVVELPAAEGAEGKPAEFELGAPGLWEELTLAATGLQAGQTADFERREGEGEAEGEAAPPRRYRLEVAEVRERSLPPLDDAFASRVGRFEDLAGLRGEVSRQLAAAKQGERRRRREQAVLAQLRDRHPLELPQGVVEHEQEHLVRDYAEGLQRRGVDVERSGIDWRSLAAEMRPHAERRVHERILLDAIAEREGIAVGEEELETALQAIGRAEGRTAPAVRQALDQGGRLSALRSQLRRDKTLGRLLGEGSTEE
jgi:trigger factor